jgi:VanZ family protein
MAVIFALSSVPGSMVPGRFGSLGHFVLYSVLGGLFYLALLPRVGRRRAAIVAVALASAYGITDEIHQVFVPGRTPDPIDWLVDTAGALVAVAAFAYATRRRIPGFREGEDTSEA